MDQLTSCVHKLDSIPPKAFPLHTDFFKKATHVYQPNRRMKMRIRVKLTKKEDIGTHMVDPLGPKMMMLFR